ncbi:hypothetical protein ACFL38_03885 [Candidatus Omnitrophota bacterium]
MIYKWETELERTARFMKIPAKKKLTWLLQMNRFIEKFSSKQLQEIRKKIREGR